MVAFGKDAARFDVVAAALFYLLSFVLTSFGSWGVVIALERAAGRGLDFKDYAGLGRARPALALAMMNVIINEGLYDREFVEKWTNAHHLVRKDTGKLLSAWQ